MALNVGAVTSSRRENRDGGTATGLSRSLGLFHATMVVMGGTIGAGIFINPYVVAREVHHPAEILAAWALGGVVAMCGAFVYAELGARMPEAGGNTPICAKGIGPE